MLIPEQAVDNGGILSAVHPRGHALDFVKREADVDRDEGAPAMLGHSCRKVRRGGLLHHGGERSGDRRGVGRIAGLPGEYHDDAPLGIDDGPGFAAG